MSVENQNTVKQAPEEKETELKNDQIIPEITIKDLKAEAYDIIAKQDFHRHQIDQLQQQLQQINEKIIIKTQEEIRKGK